MERTGKRIIAYRILTAALFVGSVLFAVFRFQASFIRTLTALQDLVLSLIYYVVKMFGGADTMVTVTEIPYQMIEIMPMTPEEFALAVEQYFAKFWSVETLTDYLYYLRDVAVDVGLFIVRASLPVGAFIIIAYVSYDTVDNEHGKETFFFRVWRRFEKDVYYPMKNNTVDFFRYFLGNFGKWFALIWLYNLNVLTIIGEALAFVFYVCMSLDYGNIFTQGAKLIVDASIAIDFLPWFVWVIIAYKIFNKIRREHGFRRLEEREAHNQAFLEENPGNMIATGRPRMGKTQAITDMALSQQVIFREKAKEKMFERSMEFPCFKWGILEESLKRMRENVPNFNLDYIRKFIGDMKAAFYGRAIMSPWAYFACLRKYQNVGYIGKDYCFGYDYQSYGLTKNNKLKIVNLFDTLELYSEEYYIYTAPTPLILGNYPIRSSIRWMDFGNTPLLISDFFRVDPEDDERQYSHMVPLDALRLGRKKDPNNPFQYAFELGAVVLSELGKELGNQNTNAGIKADADECNVRNDLFVTNAKMQSHGTTIDYYTYFRIFGDEQRAASILADFRELGSELRIVEKRDEVILMPGFLLGETLYYVFTPWMKRVKDFFEVRHAKGTLLFYFLIRLYALLVFDPYDRVRNQFASYEIRMKMIDHSAGDLLTDSRIHSYFISRKKVCSDVYDTAFFGGHYQERQARSKVGGINQTPQYTSLKPTEEQRRWIGSHFYDTVDKIFTKDAA